MTLFVLLPDKWQTLLFSGKLCFWKKKKMKLQKAVSTRCLAKQVEKIACVSGHWCDGRCVQSHVLLLLESENAEQTGKMGKYSYYFKAVSPDCSGTIESTWELE